MGKKVWLDRLKLHPLLRALRIDKLTLAALEATLKLYLDSEQAQQQIPVLQMLSLSLADVEQRAQTVSDRLQQQAGGVATFSVEKDYAVAGGGALPLERIPTWVVAIAPLEMTPDTLDSKLRCGYLPVFARIARDKLLLDLRTVLPDELNDMADAVIEALLA